MAAEDITKGLTVCELRHAHRGAIMAILRCGPSLRGFDFDRLLRSNILTVGTNRVGLVCATDYWIATETKQVLLDISRRLNRRTKAIVRVDASKNKEVIVPHYTYRIIGEKWIFLKDEGCIDSDQYDSRFEAGEFYSLASVITTAIEFCRFTGTSKVFLFGVDLRSHEDGSYYFNPAWKPNITEKNSEMKKIVQPDSSEKDILLMHFRMRRGFVLARRSIWKDFDVINVSPGTSADQFPV